MNMLCMFRGKPVIRGLHTCTPILRASPRYVNKVVVLSNKASISKIRFSSGSIYTTMGHSPLYGNTMASLTTKFAHNGLQHGTFTTKRHFHQSHYKLYSMGKRPFFEGRTPVTIFRLTPMKIFLFALTFYVMIFLLVPFILSILLPAAILGYAFFQYRKWRLNCALKLWVNSLMKTQMHTKFSTFNGLRYSIINSVEKDARSQVFGFTNTPNGPIFRAMNDMTRDLSTEASDKFKKFIEARVLEAFVSDEDGVRSALASDHTWKQAIKTSRPLGIEFGRMVERSFVARDKKYMTYAFPLSINSPSGSQSHLGRVSIVACHPLSAGFNPPDKTNLKLILCIESNSKLSPDLFIIDTNGMTGEFFSKYDVQKFKDHTEYTVKK
ncbi:hypothetical protein TPHA_0P00670 [Tetrapisispora phaffii CBS 4417]|uniref:Uncharacterized protein n=1 Tax=Tetrapisispora phaffii (strain ATCC 24235 / CBS 4417 / NBRC 1672 / NRRL Y-8282 / UCD 70-5) TaxID=1071381 RepID=G8C247_TETPH|nr:hypothetical protein TPHA_0P00670 [Tetrapisispora phaffii CBS 4417]CCE66225.1 hypothetical protein TPHA_0P00670 [Tetrapisispora phaffii CBS 4417]